MVLDRSSTYCFHFKSMVLDFWMLVPVKTSQIVLFKTNIHLASYKNARKPSSSSSGIHLITMLLRSGKRTLSSDNDVCPNRVSEKRICASENDVERDRLSEMPDQILIHILSCLPLLDAVRTVLLRRFGNLWIQVPNLEFDTSKFLSMTAVDGQKGDARRFFNFVSNVMALHTRPFIDNFTLNVDFSYYPYGYHQVFKPKSKYRTRSSTRFCYSSFYDFLLIFYEREEVADDVKMWLRLALDRHTKVIKFCVAGEEAYFESSILPNFTSQYLVTLELENCKLERELQVNLPSLKKLLLEGIGMREDSFQQFLCGCPALQELGVVDPYDIERLSFSAPNIVNLSLVLMDGYDEYEKARVLDFPKLKCLELHINRITDVIDVSSVRNIGLKGLFYDMDDEDEQSRCKTFLGKFEGAEVFGLSHNASEPFLHSVVDLQLSQTRWKSIALGLQVFCESCLAGIYQLISNLQHLEELTIYISNVNIHKDFETSSVYFHPEFSSCVMPQLKIVTVHGYMKPWNRQLQLFEFILKSAPILEKLELVPNEDNLHGLTESDELEFVIHLMRFPRSSPSATIVLC